jgi:hypothetical protein
MLPMSITTAPACMPSRTPSGPRSTDSTSVCPAPW